MLLAATPKLEEMDPDTGVFRRLTAGQHEDVLNRLYDAHQEIADG